MKLRNPTLVTNIAHCSSPTKSQSCSCQSVLTREQSSWKITSIWNQWIVCIVHRFFCFSWNLCTGCWLSTLWSATLAF